MSAGSASRAPDPRVARSREVILRAALAELGEAGYGGFAIESVAARAGVGKSTIYRHWRDKLELIADAFQTFHEQEGPDLATGSRREKLVRIVRHLAELVASGSPFSACFPALVEAAERDRGLRDFHHRFQAEASRPLVALIAEGLDAGDFPSHLDPELAALALLGVVFYRRLMSSATFEPARADALVETVIGPPTTRPRRR